jgi:RNA-directed DNA polymerase
MEVRLRGRPGGARSPEQYTACRSLQLRAAGLGTHDESRRGASSPVIADRRELGRVLAGAFLAGPWEPEAMAARGRRVLGRAPAWLGDVVQETLLAYHRPPLDRPRELAAYVALALEERPRTPRRARVRRAALFTTEMGFAPWPVPRLDAPGELAELLELDAGQLAWLADVRGLERAAPERLRNYRYLHVPRRSGPPRVIERPKLRLKEVQRRLLRELLVWIPTHPAAHGFVAGRSAITHARAHAGRRVVVRLDLEDFFAGVTAARVYGIFRTAGYPEAVAHALTGLCTNVVPPELSVPEHFRLARRLATPHLPQGAPTSPALANLAAFRLDRRLTGLAAAAGATYTRYADDLVLSCDHRLRTPAAMIAEIAAAEGFRVNRAKTRVMSRAARQTVTGMVVNERLNAPRRDYDSLKAILHNAAVHGPGELDPAHLRGRIAWVESLNPARGAKLRARFDAITWSA